MTTDLILGTAGHIDHGKTSLIKALTGVDTDRLPEEKLRGITIDLGFAQLTLGEFRLGIVDVPGHERFVRNMLAGATGIDLALLVVAADDSVKPQTREHLEILRLVDLDAGVIALTKCDLPEADWLELVEEEVRELVRGTFLESAPIVRTSAATGQGLEELRSALSSAAQRAASSARRKLRQAPFRLAIDRAFTVAGHGAVVTGSVASGVGRLGDELTLEPGGVHVRVRGLHSHDEPVEEVHRGQRAAVNLAGVHHDDIRRGQELASPGFLHPSSLLTVHLHLIDSVDRPLKHRSHVRCHLGTAELMASVALLDCDRLQPGCSAPAQLFLNEPAVATWGQPFVLRSESPVATIGGGKVLDPCAAKLPRHQEDLLARLAELRSPEPLERASAAACFFGLKPWRPHDLVRAAGVDDADALIAELIRRGELQELTLSASRKLLVHEKLLGELFARIEGLLEREHEAYPLRTTLERAPLASRIAYLGSDALVDAILNAMQRAGRLRMNERGVALPGRGPQLSNNEQKLLTQMIDVIRAAGYQSPSVDELRSQAVRNQQSAPQLLALAVAEGQLVEISPGYYIHAETEQRLRHALDAALTGGQGLTVSQIRELLAVSRKYAVPLCEYLDRIGFTRREGDLRLRGESRE
ncbi:MAG TPA: selenocysteine-specific translation elongation factor [Pirellulales bacterium]|nr:selenocysteine-specific translation elongation factor [Pirellulales bacterium]